MGPAIGSFWAMLLGYKSIHRAAQRHAAGLQPQTPLLTAGRLGAERALLVRRRGHTHRDKLRGCLPTIPN
jgi:hypothetical protein